MWLTCGTPLQRKREFLVAYMALVEEAIGDRAEDMLELASLETAPAKQGRGYASALVNALHEMVGPH